MKKFALGLLAAACASALWASDTVRDEFFWLGEMNKATTVINTDEKLLDKAVVKKVAHGLQTVIANGNKQGGPRPKEVIKFEPFLIKEAGRSDERHQRHCSQKPDDDCAQLHQRSSRSAQQLRALPHGVSGFV